jgi:plasmid stabilization system protein ParE
MGLIVHPDAQQEADGAAAYYDNIQAGLGRNFLEELDHAVQLAARVPRTFAPVTIPGDPREVRKTFVRRFPYTVYFEVRAADIVVFAISHQKRRQLYWTHRRYP